MKFLSGWGILKLYKSCSHGSELLVWFFHCRFCDSYSNQLPLWLRPVVRNYENFGQAMRDMTAFFKTAEKLVQSFVLSKKCESLLRRVLGSQSRRLPYSFNLKFPWISFELSLNHFYFWYFSFPLRSRRRNGRDWVTLQVARALISCLRVLPCHAKGQSNSWTKPAPWRPMCQVSGQLFEVNPP